MPRPTAWSTSFASATSARCCATRVRSICSSTRAAGMLGVACAWPGNCADACCRRSDCTRLALGLDRRFARPTRSRMRARYDNPSCPSCPPKRRQAPQIGSCRTSLCDLNHIFGLVGLWRTLTDVCGLLRTLATCPTRAVGVCICLTSAAQWTPGPEEGRRRCRAERPGAPAKFKIAVPVSDVLSRGVSSPSTPLSPEASARHLLPGMTRASRGQLLRNASAGPALAANDDASRRGTPCCPSQRKESHDGQAAVPVGSAIRAG